jgi:hypothetical protein
MRYIVVRKVLTTRIRELAASIETQHSEVGAYERASK